MFKKAHYIVDLFDVLGKHKLGSNRNALDNLTSLLNITKQKTDLLKVEKEEGRNQFKNSSRLIKWK